MKAARQQGFNSTIRFSVPLFQPKKNKTTESRVRLLLPKTVSVRLPSRDMIKVEGIIKSLPFRAVLERDGKGSQWLTINKAMRDAVDMNVEGTAPVEITRIGEETETRIPRDFREALLAAPQAHKVWSDITPVARRDWIFWILSAKQSETRTRRIEKACDMLASGKRRVCCFGGIAWLMKNN